MAETVSKLTCPECGKVLKPAKPLPVGKKAKCPQCGSIFVAEDPDREPEPVARPAAKPARKSAIKKEAPEPASKKVPAKKSDKIVKGKPAKEEKPAKKHEEDDDEGGSYAVIKDKDEEDEEKKPKINYAPDMSIKDLRGPAQAMIMGPSNLLIIAGIAGFIGWLGLIVMILIPIVFPLKPDEKDKPAIMPIEPGMEVIAGVGGGPGKPGMPNQPAGGVTGPSAKYEEEGESFFELGPIDLTVIASYEWWQKTFSFTILFLFLCYSGTMTYGAVKMQNLESREWGIASTILGIIPFNVGALMFVSAILVREALDLILDEKRTIYLIVIVWMVLVWLLSIGASVYALVTLMKEEVIAGYEYKAE
jgi:hypothetical protein